MCAACIPFSGISVCMCIWLVVHSVFIIFVWDKHYIAVRQIQAGAVIAWSFFWQETCHCSSFWTRCGCLYWVQTLLYFRPLPVRWLIWYYVITDPIEVCHKMLRCYLISLHPVLKIIYCEIEIRAHKQRLPAVIIMKDYHQCSLCVHNIIHPIKCTLVTCIVLFLNTP